MRWLRSWPDVIPPHRAYVVDELERLITHDYDYTPLGDIHEDVCIVEWDVAIDHLGKVAFEIAVEKDREHVHVAPHYLFHVAPGPVYAHRQIVDAKRGLERWIDYGQECDLFAFGLIYLPHALVAAFLDEPAPERGRPPWVPVGHYGDMRFCDQTFSMWHYKYGLQARVVWEAYATHLHEAPSPSR